MGQWAGDPPKDREEWWWMRARLLLVGERDAKLWRLPQWLEVPRHGAQWDVSQLRRRSGVCRCSTIWRRLPWRSRCGRPREEALNKVTEDATADDGELSPQLLDENMQKYKEMLSSLALRNATEEEYWKTRGI